MTGTVSDVRTVEAGVLPGEGVQTVGAELVLAAGEHRLQVRTGGRADDVEPGSRVTVTGEPVLVGADERDALDLSDTRADLVVRGVLDLPGGDVAVEVVPAARSRAWNDADEDLPVRPSG